MASQLDRDMAFAAGKYAAEQADSTDMLEYARNMAQVPEPVQGDFKDGWSFACDNMEAGYYVRTNDIGEWRIKNWLEGRPLPEQAPASLVVNPRTVNRVQTWLGDEPTMDMDSVVNLALDCLAHYYDLWFGADKSDGTTEKMVRERFAKAVHGTTYWDGIDEVAEVHRGETS